MLESWQLDRDENGWTREDWTDHFEGTRQDMSPVLEQMLAHNWIGKLIPM